MVVSDVVDASKMVAMCKTFSLGVLYSLKDFISWRDRIYLELESFND